MDLIEEYYNEKGYDTELNQKFETKRKKIVAWQKKFKIKTTSSIPLISAKKLIKLKNKLKISTSKLNAGSRKSIAGSRKSVAVSYVEKEFSKIFSDLFLCFNPDDCEHISCRDHATQLIKYGGPIEKFAAFEKKIRYNFRKRYEENFPDSNDVLKDVLNLMFQTADNSFTKTLKVNTKHLRVIPDTTAKYLNVKYSLWEQIHNLVKQDLNTGKKYNTLPKSSFGTTLHNDFKFEPKANDFKSRWHSYSQYHAYHQDLETFAAVWKNITHLQTTRRFCAWLANNSNITPPAYLENEGLVKENMSFDFSAESNSMYDEYIAPETIIQRPFRKTRQLVLDTVNTNSSSSTSSLVSGDISDINIIV